MRPTEPGWYWIHDGESWIAVFCQDSNPPGRMGVCVPSATKPESKWWRWVDELPMGIRWGGRILTPDETP